MKVFLSSFLVALSMNAFAVGTQMDDLIRGEMAAVRSYKALLADMSDGPVRKKLVKIKENHENAVAKLKTFASADVKEDTTSAGAWGTFATTWAKGAKLIGNNTALKALKQGEEHGVDEYKEALADDTIKPEVKQMIKTQFLPTQEEHIKSINGLM